MKEDPGVRTQKSGGIRLLVSDSCKNMGKLDGKVAIVTGAAGGIGQAICQTLTREGAAVVALDIDLSRCQKLVQEIEKSGGQALAIQTDVTNKADITRMVDTVMQKWGRIDILVNNAGIISFGPVAELAEEEWDRVLRINLKSVFLCSQAVMGAMKKQKSGKIVNMGSLAGKVGGIVVSSAYAASKAGVMCLTLSLAKELAPFNVNVNALAPGPVDTEMTRAFPPGALDQTIQQTPLKRQATPQDIANVVLFLVTEDSRHITGEVIDVNGGILMDI